MAAKLRKSPPVCLWVSMAKLLFGKVRFSRRYLGKRIATKDAGEFWFFRHITIHPPMVGDSAVVFIARFKFARLPHWANKITSILPMFMIAGFPGFVTKMYAVNRENGYWQGMYQWQSKQALEEYKQSFVYRAMKRRAIKDSLSETEFDNTRLIDFIEESQSRTKMAE